MIKINNIRKTYKSNGNTVHALKGINLDIEKGEIFGIIGLSGAGKSTLIRTLNRLEEPSAGKIIISDQNILDFNNKQLSEYRKKVGMIFQHFNLLKSRTVEGNIKLPLEIAKVDSHLIDKRVKELLELVNLTEKNKSYPSQLSGGQKQRVAIARALANNPKLLLCDEATSALDPKTTKNILNLLKSISTKLGLTVVLITHEMDVIKTICDRVAVIDDGLIVEQGKVEDVFNSPQEEITKEFLVHLPTINEKIVLLEGVKAC